MLSSRFATLVLTIFVCLFTTQVNAQSQSYIYVYDSNTGRLLGFSSAASRTFTSSVTLTGLQPNERLRRIAFRPGDAQLYGLGNTNRLYRINHTTGAATPVGTAPIAANFHEYDNFGFDFDPITDRIRIVTSYTRQNLQVNPDTGAIHSADTQLTHAPGDTNADELPHLFGLAYSGGANGTGGGVTQTTAYALDYTNGGIHLATLGSVGGSPTSPDTGQVFTVGALNDPLRYRAVNIGFDLAADNSIAYAMLIEFGTFVPNLYAIDLATGATVMKGAIGSEPLNLTGFAVAPVTATLEPVADAYVKGATPDQNYGTSAELQIKRAYNASSGKGRQAYLRFDTSSVTGTIRRATLRVYGRLNHVTAANRNIPCAVFPVSDATWTEPGLTWANKPRPNEPREIGRVIVTDDAPRRYEFDITAFLNSERAAGRHTTGVLLRNMLRGEAGDFYTVFNSKEAAENRPRLLIQQ